MDLTTIEYQKKGAIAYVTLNRPDKLNAMNEVLHDELARVWADFRDDGELRVAILSGKGRCFSAGADLSGGAPANYEYTGHFADISQTQKVYKPIISALHSHVVGYGMWIALDADFRIATPDVTFWLPEPQLSEEPTPEEEAERADDVSVAFLLLLERLAGLAKGTDEKPGESSPDEAEAWARHLVDAERKCFLAVSEHRGARRVLLLNLGV